MASDESSRSRLNFHTGGAGGAAYACKRTHRSFFGAGRNVAFSESSRTQASVDSKSVCIKIVAVTQLPKFVNVPAHHIDDVFFRGRILFQMLLHLIHVGEVVNLNAMTAAARRGRGGGS